MQPHHVATPGSMTPNPYPYPYPAPPPPPPPKKGMSTCLIVLLVFVALGGVFGVVFVVLGIYGAQKYISAAKTAEARNGVTQIAHDAVAAYERERIGSGTHAEHHLCRAAIPVPAVVPKGVKYQPSSAAGSDFNTGNDEAGWKCLRFQMTSPMFYQYMYEPGVGSGKSGATANGFEARARGDLNGDGKTSLFARGADIRNGEVIVSTELYVEDENE